MEYLKYVNPFFILVLFYIIILSSLVSTRGFPEVEMPPMTNTESTETHDPYRKSIIESLRKVPAKFLKGIQFLFIPGKNYIPKDLLNMESLNFSKFVKSSSGKNEVLEPITIYDSH